MSDSGVRISDLPEAGVLTGSEILPLVQAGDTKRGTLGDLANLVGSVGDAAIADSVATLPTPTNSGNWGIVPFGAEEGLYQDTGTWVRRSDTQAQRSIAGADLSEAWAEGTLPGGAGTKSAREYAEEADASADDAAAVRDAALQALAAADARLQDTYPIFADDPLYGQAVDVDSTGRVVFGLSGTGTVYGQSTPTFPIFADDPLYGSNIAVNENGVLIIGASPARPAAGKIIVFLGDSITGNYGIPALVASLTGATAHNFAWGGSRVSSGGSAFANAYSVAAIAAAVASGNWTAIIAGVDADYPTGSATDVAARARVRAMAAFNWATPDLIMILGGTNDWSAQVPLGAADSTTTTQFNGGLNEAIRQFQAARPAAQIALATPAWRGPLATLGDSNVNPNGAGVFLSAFGDAIRANRWQLPVLDLARTLGINLSNKTLMLADDLHPTTTGAARWAQRITVFINSLF